MAPKKKTEKMSIGDFLQDQSLGSWADEMDSQPIPSAPSGYGRSMGGRDMGGERRAFTGPATWERGSSGVGGGMGGRGPSYDRPRFSDREQLPLPDKPPYTAHLGNLSFDVTSQQIEDFLTGCQPTNVRIVEDKLDRKPKGFGYVEFATLDGLKQALSLSGTNFMGRDIRLSVAEPPKDRPDSTRDFSTWERRGPLPDLPSQGRQPSNRGFNRSFTNDNISDAGSERGGSRRGGFFEGDGKVRDFSNWERKGPLSPAPGQGPPVRDGGRLREGGPSVERRNSPSWGEGTGRGSEAGSRPPRREFQERPAYERVPTAAEQDNQWRARMRPDPSPAATPEASTPSSPAAAQAPKERPKLNLAKRTVSNVHEIEAPDATQSDSKASPFGAARPIDTATREREIAEKREIVVRQKVEAEAKALEEKKTKEAAARAARAERADKGHTQQDEAAPSPTDARAGNRRPSRQQNGTRNAQQPKENGEKQVERERPNFNILSRSRDEVADAETEGVEDTPDASANGNIIGDKETKPQEVTREVAQDGATTQVGETTAPAMEEEGWSTVAAKSKNNRRGGGGRALAS